MSSAYTIPDLMKLKKATIFFNERDMKELKRISRESLIPVSALVRKAIQDFIREWKKKPARR